MSIRDLPIMALSSQTANYGDRKVVQLVCLHSQLKRIHMTVCLQSSQCAQDEVVQIQENYVSQVYTLTQVQS